MPSQQQIADAVEIALERLIRADRSLLMVDVNERSLTHRLATYLEREVESWGEDLSVDCEYNRIMSERRLYEKEVPLISFPEPRNSAAEAFRPGIYDQHASTVYPDILVHGRRPDVSGDMLLAIEVSKSTAPEEKRRCDQKKLVAYCQQFLCQQAAHVVLECGASPGYKLEWAHAIPKAEGKATLVK